MPCQNKQQPNSFGFLKEVTCSKHFFVAFQEMTNANKLQIWKEIKDAASGQIEMAHHFWNDPKLCAPVLIIWVSCLGKE